MRHAWIVVPLVAIAACGGEDESAPARDAPTAWSRLQRPLEAPRAYRSCEPSRARGIYREVGLAAGPGPVYPVLGYPASPPASRAVVAYTNGGDGIKRDGWWYHKTMWIREPDYEDRVLVRGIRLDRPGRLRFQLGGGSDRTFRALRLPADTRGVREWGVWVGSTLIREAGCYAFQIDGRRFSRVVVFRAVP